KWISRLGNAGGNYYTGMGGAGLGGSSPFFRPDIDQVINTDGYFGAMLNSLSISSFKSGMDRLEAFLGLGQQVAGLADAVPGIGGEQKIELDTFRIWTTQATGIQRWSDGSVMGSGIKYKNVRAFNLSKRAFDSLNKVKTDSNNYWNRQIIKERKK
ncbi:hypothetical protein, partial [Chryseobacterium sp. MFBS3-17]|uniref:hypothetical protein n=1 Tax=Chryseobacterium sp. MFBS3-17 TaxID=2886689 RepID=UPI001D0EA08A